MRASRKVVMLGAGTLLVAACSWNPWRPFEHDSPAVNEALGALDAGDAQAAAATLEEYLSTGPCAEGSIGSPPRLEHVPYGTFDLGLALFKIGEAYGKRFGEENADAGADALTLQRSAQIDCALRVARAVANDEATPLELRARAHYLEGNLQFLGQHYEDAVKAYDLALGISPGQHDAGDPVGRDAAWNRAIALRRIEDQKKDAGSDAGNDGGGDGGNDGGRDGGDGGHDAGGDSGRDSGGASDASPPDSGSPPPPKDDHEDAGAPPPPSNVNQDDRILDRLENAPTVQQEAARKAAAQHRVRGTADK